MLNRILLLPGVVCLIHQLCRELVDSVFELYYDGQLHSKSRAISLKERQCTCMYMYLHVHDASIATHAVAIDCSILLCIQVHTRTNSYTRTREIVSKCRARAFIHVMKLQRSKVVATFLSLAACNKGEPHPLYIVMLHCACTMGMGTALFIYSHENKKWAMNLK